MYCRFASLSIFVHGDIRHLETIGLILGYAFSVHGDIRHLEKTGNIEIK